MHLFAAMLGGAATDGRGPGRAIGNALFATLGVIGCLMLLAALSAAGS